MYTDIVRLDKLIEECSKSNTLSGDNSCPMLT